MATRDFFKNNLWFSQTNRKMMDEMANHSTHVRKHIEKQGYDTVEKWLDICLSVEHLIDPHSMFLKRGPDTISAVRTPSAKSRSHKFKAKDYLDRWINPPAKLEAEAKKLRDDAKQDAPRHARRIRRATCCYICSNTRGWKTGRPIASRSCARKPTTSRRRA